jgi:para-nitrobenzyl esterase
VYRDERPGATVDDIWSDFATDWIFRIPATRLAEAQSINQPDTYAYLFTYRSTAFDGALGACHAIDVPFAFDNLERRGVDMFLGGITDDARALATATSRAWLAVAHSGTPQHDGLPEWPRYSEGHRSVMELGIARHVLDDPGSAERQLWASLLV